MKLYLDDDSIDTYLIQLLRKAGHDVCVPADLGLAGSDDPVHLRHAIREARTLLSRNAKDFRQLHYLIREASGHHPGIFITRFDNDPKRDPKPPDIVRAIRNFLAARIPLADEYVILNAWR